MRGGRWALLSLRLSRLTHPLGHHLDDPDRRHLPDEDHLDEVHQGDPFLVMVKKDCYPDAKPDEEFPFPVLMRMGCYLDEEFQVLKKLEQRVRPAPLLPELLALPVQQVLDFTLDEVRDARLVPVVDFKGRRPKMPGDQPGQD